MFVLSSISSGLSFLSENHASIYENSELKVCKNIVFLLKCLAIGLMIY